MINLVLQSPGIKATGFKFQPLAFFIISNHPNAGGTDHKSFVTPDRKAAFRSLEAVVAKPDNFRVNQGVKRCRFDLSEPRTFEGRNVNDHKTLEQADLRTGDTDAAIDNH